LFFTREKGIDEGGTIESFNPAAELAGRAYASRQLHQAIQGTKRAGRTGAHTFANEPPRLA